MTNVTETNVRRIASRARPLGFRSISALAIVGAILAGAFPFIARASDPDRWPSFRGGPAMTGVAATPIPEKLELLWTFKTGDSIASTCAIADGVVYCPTAQDGRLIAIALADGKEIWTFTNDPKDGAKSSPCIAENIVAYGDMFGVFHAVDRKTGRELWKLPTDDKIESSPTFVNGKILFGSYDGGLYCVDAASGQQVWKFTAEGPVHSSPTVIGAQAGAAGCDGFLRLINLDTGKEASSLEIGGNLASTPAVAGERLIFGTMSFQVLAVDSKTMKTAWTYENPKRQFEYASSPAVEAGVVVIGGRDKFVHAINLADGKEKWMFRTRSRVDSSPIIAGQRVFVGSGDGNVYGIDLDTGEKVWEFVTGADVVASFAAASGRLVIGNQAGDIFCFGKKE